MSHALAFLCSLAVLGVVAQQNNAQQAPSCTLRIHADGFRNERGKAGAALFRTTQGWPEDASRSFLHNAFPIQNGISEISFDGIPAGRYAVVLFHDQNVNGKLDRNFIGIPSEGFGFANNPRIYLRPPSFAAASVDVHCPVTETTIHLIYMK